MSPETIFRIHLVLGYVAWLLCFSVYILPRLRSMDRASQAHRAIATLHSFRFFGLVFILPGVVGPNLPAGFATYSAPMATSRLGCWPCWRFSPYGSRPLFWSFVVAFNLVGASRYRRRLLPRHPGRSPCHRRGVRLCLCHPDPLRAAPDDHALRRHSIGWRALSPAKSLRGFSRNMFLLAYHDFSRGAGCVHHSSAAVSALDASISPIAPHSPGSRPELHPRSCEVDGRARQDFRFTP